MVASVTRRCGLSGPPGGAACPRSPAAKEKITQDFDIALKKSNSGWGRFATDFRLRIDIGNVELRAKDFVAGKKSIL